MKKMDTQFLTQQAIINVTKEPRDAHKKTLKEEIMEETTEKFMEKILDMAKQNATRCTQKISRHQK
jgi:hypothetical protein